MTLHWGATISSYRFVDFSVLCMVLASVVLTQCNIASNKENVVS